MKQLAALAIIFAVGFVLFDVQTAFVGLACFVTGYALMLIPGKAWLALGEGLAEMAPWIWISTL
jgi:hypothetical protein